MTPSKGRKCLVVLCSKEEQRVIYEGYWRVSLLVTGVSSFLVCLFVWFDLNFISIAEKSHA